MIGLTAYRRAYVTRAREMHRMTMQALAMTEPPTMAVRVWGGGGTKTELKCWEGWRGWERV